jgi:Na+-exporting ATPase
MEKKCERDDGQQPRVSGQGNSLLSLPPHALGYDVVVAELFANPEDGLNPEDAKGRLEKYGRNELDDRPGVRPVDILIRQIANAMVLVKRTLITILLLQAI